jgi:hypothetical protein
MPTDFLDLIETYDAQEASTSALYGDAGRRLRGHQQSPRYTQGLTEAARLMGDVAAGRRPMRALSEAMTTSDFPNLFGDILDRQLLAEYLETPQVWSSFARRSTVRDFRTVKRFAVDGAEGTLSAVGEKAPYPAAGLVDSVDSYAVVKHGRRLHFSWEDFINDDLDGLRSAPQRLARAARRSEDYFATGLWVDANGPHASLYTSGNKNIVTSNPVLSVAALQTAFTILASQVDNDGMPIMIDAVTLVVPPALQVTATNIINATEILIAAGSTSGTADRLRVANWMQNKVNLVVDYYIPLIATSAHGSTTWALFAEPSVGRPALEVGFLRGHESPELFMKSSDNQSIGGMAGDMDGDFDTDSVQYKVRHTFGGTRLTSTGGAKSTVASNGSGS